MFKFWHLVSTNCSHLCQNMGASIMLVKTFTMFLHIWVIRGTFERSIRHNQLHNL